MKNIEQLKQELNSCYIAGAIKGYVHDMRQITIMFTYDTDIATCDAVQAYIKRAYPQNPIIGFDIHAKHLYIAAVRYDDCNNS